jgi:outer membrane immunogenic protein
MKKILLSTVALLSLSAGAMAADLPSRRMAPAPMVAAVPLFTWTGFYFGVNAGYGWSDHHNDDTIVFAPGTFTPVLGTAAGGTITFSDGNGDADGWLGGAQIGFNWQFGAGSGLVVGVEADIQAIDLDRDQGRFDTFSTSVALGLPAGTTFSPVRNEVSTLDWFGTVRGRVGFAIDRVLIYGTGGFAFAGGDHDGRCDSVFSSRSECRFSNDDTRWGYAIGGGVEWALPMAGWFGSSAVTFKVEGLYVNLDEDNDGDDRIVGFTTSPAGVVTAVSSSGTARIRDDETDFGLIRAGINFKF